MCKGASALTVNGHTATRCADAGGGSINRSRLVQLLVFLARDEEAAYKRRSVRLYYPCAISALLQCCSGSTACPQEQLCLEHC